MKTFISILTVGTERIVGSVLESPDVAPPGFVEYADSSVQPGWLWDGTKAAPRPAVVAPIPFVTTPEDPLIAALYTEAKRRADAAVDDSASKKYLSWKYDPTSSAARKQKIAEVEAWADTVWQMYATCKAAVKAGDRTIQLTPEADFPKCPWTFWDIAGA
jgi:hypothetical protein